MLRDCPARPRERSERRHAWPRVRERAGMANATTSAASTLDAASLARSVLSLGGAPALRAFFSRLDAGQPVTVGVFGASVAQNAGCLDQPYKRCMRYDGVHRTYMKWGEPKIRPFKGFAVRFLERINATWPHRLHQINNSALDATPAQNALSCLFSHLPTTLHLVVLEFGSMAFHLKLAAVESAARMLLSLSPPSQRIRAASSRTSSSTNRRTTPSTASRTTSSTRCT